MPRHFLFKQVTHAESPLTLSLKDKGSLINSNIVYEHICKGRTEAQIKEEYKKIERPDHKKAQQVKTDL